MITQGKMSQTPAPSISTPKTPARSAMASRSLPDFMTVFPTQSGESEPQAVHRPVRCGHVAPACRRRRIQEARQGRLHCCETLETDFTFSNARKAAGVGRGRKDLTCGRDVWAPPDQPLRSTQTTV